MSPRGPAAADLARYREQGYLLIPELVDRTALARFEARFLELATGAAARPAELVVMRDVMVVQGAVTPPTPLHAVNKILSFETDETLFAYALEASLLAWVRALIGPDLVTLSTNVFAALAS